MRNKITILEGDITRLNVDAIVNAANQHLQGGGGVDGAIHKAAGPELLKECLSLNGCKTGEVKITHGYHLPAKWVIHTVGPVWQGGECNEDKLLASCYHNSLQLAEQHDIRTIAFPSISTGAFGFPVKRAARIAISEMMNYMEAGTALEKSILVCFDENTYQCYTTILEELSEIHKTYRVFPK